MLLGSATAQCFVWKGQARCPAHWGAICFAACAPLDFFSGCANLQGRNFFEKKFIKTLRAFGGLCHQLPLLHAAWRILHHHMAGGQLVPDGVGGSPVLLVLAGFGPLLDKRLDLTVSSGESSLPAGLAWPPLPAGPRDSTGSKSRAGTAWWRR